MRPEVRERHAQALARIGAHDDAFLTRLERFLTELHDPLHAVYGGDERLPAAWDELLDAMATFARDRPAELRRLDHEREITPDWLLREQAVGYVAYADRFAGTLQGVRERLPYLRELGVSYLHLMPLLRMRQEPNDGGYAVTRLRARSSRRSARWPTCASSPPELRASGIALCVDVVLNHTAREHPVGGRGTRGRRAAARLLPHVPGPHGARRVRAHAAGGLPRHRAGELHVGRGAASAGCGRRSTPTSGISTTPTPRCSSRWRRRCSASPRSGVDVLRLDAVPFLWKRLGTNCQNQPEVARPPAGLPRGAADRRAGGRVQGGGDRRAARPRRLPRGRPPRRHGVRPRVPQRPHGPALEHARVAERRAPHAHARRRCRRCPPRRGLAHLRPLPRRHRLGDHRRGRRPGGGGRRGAPPLPLAVLHRATFPGSFARGARFQPEPGGESRISGMAASLAGLELALERGDELDAELALRRLLVAVRRRVRARRAAASSGWATSSRCATTRLGAGSGARATTTAGCTVRPWTGTAAARRTERRTPEGHGLGRACGGSSRRAGRSARCNGSGVSRPVWTWRRPRPRPRCASTRATGCCSWPASASSGARSPLSLLDEHGVEARCRARRSRTADRCESTVRRWFSSRTSTFGSRGVLAFRPVRIVKI